MKHKNLLQNAALVLILGLGIPVPGTSQQAGERASDQSGTPRDSHLVPDIISDNLDRVAAPTDKILEILKQEVGLMVELKRLLAQDAGTAGQILEESDLTDEAVAQRLQSDLRARVLATHLLQRYGFLVPRLNPGSDMQEEHKLVLQERAQILARAEQRAETEPATTLTRQTALCDPQSAQSCQAQPRPLQELRNPPSAPVEPPVPFPGRGSASQVAETSPDLLAPPDEAGAGIGVSPLLRSQPDPTKAASVQAAASQGALVPSAYSVPDGFSSTSATQPGFHSSSRSTLPTEQQPDWRPPQILAGSERYSNQRSLAAGHITEPEPVRMVRRPSPYADVPSLYDLYVQAASNRGPLERFGVDVFRNRSTNLEYLPMDLPVGPNYVLGPGDGLAIDLWGGVSNRITRVVDREGRVTLPEVGPVLVSGRSLGDVQQDMQRILREQFRDVSVDVSLQRLRTVRVYVVGDVLSAGAYDISSLSTPLNALFAAGGVTQQGSLRHLEHRRGKQLVEEVDAYDLLLHGIRGDLSRLQDGDSLLVPPLGPVVTVEGMVRRPDMYELHNEKNLEDVLDLAGGILPAAALRHIEVQRLVAHEKRTMLSVEIGESTDPETIRTQLRNFAVHDGDDIHIFPIAPYNSAAVYLEGHVLRPGRYSFSPGMKLSDLVTSYSDLLPEPAGSYAEIIRLHSPDYHPVVESFDLAAALAHPEAAPKLEPLDTVRIFGRYDLEPAPEILVTGEVRAPGQYRTSGQQHLLDAIYQAGGLTPGAWLESAQLYRNQPDGTTRVFSISLRDALSGDALNNILLHPRDRILIHRQPELISPATVLIGGDVGRPGRYPLATNMRISDLVRSAGGVLRSASLEGADLTRYETPGKPSGQGTPAHQTVDLAAVLAGNADEDLPLRDGDVLTVPQRAGWKDIGATITLKGEVRKPGVYGIEPGERLSSLLRRAGGLLPTAYAPAAVFERTEVRELQQKSRQDLIQRLEQESTQVKTSVNASGAEEAALQQTAMQQRDRMLEGLRRAPVSGRLVIHLHPERKEFAGSADDIELRAGDSLTIPKKPQVVVVVGQVYNSNALTYSPGKNVGWYLSRAGGPTQLANKKATFVIRADGSVTSGREGSMWMGSGALSSPIGPGDTIVVPEKTVLGGSGWKNIVAIAQIAQAAALAAAIALP
jgi:polysaccharide export outer membrane protein